MDKQQKKINNNNNIERKVNFVTLCKQVHGDKYNYDKVEFESGNKKVIVTCKIHGDFLVEARKHIKGKYNCAKCVGKYRYTSDEWISECKKIHGEHKFDYSNTVYVNTATDVTIICKIHGSFVVEARNHMHNKNGCKKCSNTTRSLNYRDTNEIFISKAQKIHGDVYDYSTVNYEGIHKKVTIICRLHGKFEQSPKKHIGKKQGCKFCAIDKKKYTTEDFIKRVVEIHQGIYDYSLVE